MVDTIFKLPEAKNISRNQETIVSGIRENGKVLPINM